MRHETRHKISRSLKRYHRRQRAKPGWAWILGIIVFIILLNVTAEAVKIAQAAATTTYTAESDKIGSHEKETPEHGSQGETGKKDKSDAILKLIEKYATEYDVSYEAMKKTVKCESNFQPKVKSNYANERSYGLAQIHLPSHPQVSKKQATDPHFALEFMAKKFAAGDHHLWTCWRLLKKRGVIK